jgi:hypothetical protein
MTKQQSNKLTKDTFFATIISRACEPMIMLTAVAVIGGFHANLTSSDLFKYLVFLALFMIIPVLGLWIWFVKKEGLSWDIPNRAKRIRPLFVVLGFVTLDTILAIQLHSTLLTQLFLVFLVWLVGFTLITMRWKISGHAGAAALATGLIVAWYGFAWWPILLIVPIVGWARVVRRDHTIAQVVAGAVYSWMLIFLFH